MQGGYGDVGKRIEEVQLLFVVRHSRCREIPPCCAIHELERRAGVAGVRQQRRTVSAVTEAGTRPRLGRG